MFINGIRTMFELMLFFLKLQFELVLSFKEYGMNVVFVLQEDFLFFFYFQGSISGLNNQEFLDCICRFLQVRFLFLFFCFIVIVIIVFIFDKRLKKSLFKRVLLEVNIIFIVIYIDKQIQRERYGWKCTCRQIDIQIEGEGKIEGYIVGFF